MPHTIETTALNGTELPTSLNLEVCRLITVSSDTYIGLIDRKGTRFCGNKLGLRLSPMFLVREDEFGIFQKVNSFSDYSFEFEGCRPILDESNPTQRAFCSSIGDKIYFLSNEADLVTVKRLMADVN